MPSVSEFRRGMAIMYSNDIYLITEFQHAKVSKQQAMIKTKLKNLRTGRVIENTFRQTDKLDKVRLEAREMQYVYQDNDYFYFMDMETYDQIPISSDLIGDMHRFMKEGMMAKLLFHNEQPVTIELPTTVELEVIEAEPAVRGDTAGNLTKSVKVETGALLQVPPFVKEGDVIKIDTRTGAYNSRV